MPYEQALMLHVHGIPHPQPRPRWIRGKMVSCIDTKTKLWADKVREAGQQAKDNVEDQGKNKIESQFRNLALSLEIGFLIPTDAAERWGSCHSAKPDIDNLVKLVMDNLFVSKGRGLLKSGDECVVQLTAWKKWCQPNEGGATIVLKPCLELLTSVTPSEGGDWLNLGV